MPPVLEIRGLTKAFAGRPAVQGLDMDVEPGTVYGFLGRNGAGKTTTLRLALGLMPRDAGTVCLLGHDLDTDRSRALAGVGALVETPGFYSNLDARRNLQLFTRGARPAFPGGFDALLDTVGLGEAGTKPFGQYSLGMKQRLGIARTLVHDPQLVILDEPTNGLDPAGIRDVRELIRGLAREGKAVLVSSHVLGEVEQVADTLGIVHRGTMVDQFSRQAFRERHRPYWELTVDDPAAAAGVLGTRLGLTDCQTSGPRSLRVYGASDRSAEVNRVLVLAGMEVWSLVSSGQGLEDYFLEITGEARHG